MTISGLSFDESIIRRPHSVSDDRCGPLGAHESIAGGLWRAVERIGRVGGTALQVFTRNQRQWSSAPLSEEEILYFAKARSAWGGSVVVSHASYLINLGSSDEAAWRRSVTAMARELDRCRTLKLTQVVVHPGSAMGSPRDKALARIAQGLDAALEEAGDGLGELPEILLENVAGQGTSLGRTFEELAAIMEKSRYASRLGLCFDTCHAFAAGYDLASPEGFDATLQALNAQVGLERLGLLHVNDSKHALGSNRDRHEHIGLGTLGLAAFGLVMTDSRLAEIPKILETHKNKDLLEDMANLDVLRALARGDDATSLLWNEATTETGKVPGMSRE